MHPRTVLRALFVDLLTGANTEVGANVFKNRTRPFVDAEGWDSQLPAINVTCNEEQSSLYTSAPQEFERVAVVDVSTYASAGTDDEDLDDWMDTVAEQIEIVIGRFNWDSIGFKMDLAGTKFDVVESPGKAIYAVLTVRFAMTYYSLLPDEGKSDSLEYFRTADNTYRVGTQDSQQTVKLP